MLCKARKTAFRVAPSLLGLMLPGQTVLQGPFSTARREEAGIKGWLGEGIGNENKIGRKTSKSGLVYVPRSPSTI